MTFCFYDTLKENTHYKLRKLSYSPKQLAVYETFSDILFFDEPFGFYIF